MPGRYFAVKKSYHWGDILGSLKKAHPSYALPETSYKPGEEVTPTQFDFTRRDSLGVQFKDVDEVKKITQMSLPRLL